MLICQHRVNTPEGLAATSTEFGVEIDVRSKGDKLLLEHDPYLDGVDFDAWLDAYRHRFIVVNIKEEGLEARIAAALDARAITQWAFLDQSFPFLVRGLRAGETRTMVRVSEFERPQTALALEPRPDWVWVDSFTGQYPEPEDLHDLVDVGYKLMFVSPELQGRDAGSEVPRARSHFESAGIALDGVCTKRPELWQP